MTEQTFKVGTEVCIESASPDGEHGVVFEDDGATGYFYAVDFVEAELSIVDAVHIYNVENVTDRDTPSTVSIVWSADGSKSALLINGYPHATFDFKIKQGYCRTNYPNSSNTHDCSWSQSGHQWSEEAIAWLRTDDIY